MPNASQKKAKNTALIAKAGEKKKQAGELLRSMKEVLTEIDKLKENPDDPSANLAVGKYVCFVLGDWDKGLVMLSKSSDADLKTAAELDLAARDTASIMLSADKWWELSEKEKSKSAKNGMLSRSAELYQKVIPDLSGIEKVKAEKRIKYASVPMLLNFKNSAPNKAEVEVICKSGSSIEIGIVKPGEKYNTNRDYKFVQLDKSILDLEFIKFPHKDSLNNLDFIVTRSGLLYILTNPRIEIESDLEKNGFKRTNLLASTDQDHGDFSWVVFQKEVTVGEKYSFAGSAWVTPVVVAKKVKIKKK